MRISCFNTLALISVAFMRYLLDGGCGWWMVDVDGECRYYNNNKMHST